MHTNQVITRSDAISIEYQGSVYYKIGDKWYEELDESLEPAYSIESELDQYLEELEELE